VTGVGGEGVVGEFTTEGGEETLYVGHCLLPDLRGDGGLRVNTKLHWNTVGPVVEVTRGLVLCGD